MKKHLSLSQRIQNAHASQEADRLHAWHSYLHGGSRSKEEWEGFWSRREDISWAHGFGRMRGWDQVYYGNVTNYDGQCYKNYLEIYPIYPEIGGKDARALYTVAMHALGAGVVEVADDGKTARAAYLTPSTGFNYLTPEQTRWSGCLWERYGADYICEDGQWKYLHEQVCPDFSMDFDYENWAVTSYRKLKGETDSEFGAGNAPQSMFPPCADPGPMHMRYSLVQPLQNTVPWPEPYATMDENNTYTPARKKDEE